MDKKIGSLRIPSELAQKASFFEAKDYTFGGISGGRTSGLMHILSLVANTPEYYSGVFANTGKEHDKTYLFLKNIEEATGQKNNVVGVRCP